MEVDNHAFGAMSTSTISSTTAPPAAAEAAVAPGPESPSLPPWRVDVPMADMTLESFIYWKEQQRQRTIVTTRTAMAHTYVVYVRPCHALPCPG